jgi:hypothetical protein
VLTGLLPENSCGQDSPQPRSSFLTMTKMLMKISGTEKQAVNVVRQCGNGTSTTKISKDCALKSTTIEIYVMLHVEKK